MIAIAGAGAIEHNPNSTLRPACVQTTFHVRTEQRFCPCAGEWQRLHAPKMQPLPCFAERLVRRSQLQVINKPILIAHPFDGPKSIRRRRFGGVNSDTVDPNGQNPAMRYASLNGVNGGVAHTRMAENKRSRLISGKPSVRLVGCDFRHAATCRQRRVVRQALESGSLEQDLSVKIANWIERQR